MRNGDIRPRLIALVVVILLGTYYIVFDILQVHVGSQPYSVTLALPRAGGLYPQAGVTYNGVPIGRVAGIHLESTGVRVTLSLRAGTRVPADLTANVRQLSALGEQYVDLVPARAGGPYLHQGSVIAAGRTTLPVPIGTTLSDLNSLLNSVNQSDVTTVESFLATGLVGTGADLRNIVVTGQALTRALVAAEPATRALIVDGEPVLGTADATTTEVSQLLANLDQLSGQLQSSNQNVEDLLSNGSAATSGLNTLVASNENAIAGTIDGLSISAATAAQYQPAVQALFSVLPVAAGDLAATVSGGAFHGSLAINGDDTVCPYLPASEIPGPTQAVAQAALDNTCSITAPDLLQRGADRAP
jgi:phospholipid/cholesterol/gamma-HCH transport system substrate-binding protein